MLDSLPELAQPLADNGFLVFLDPFTFVNDGMADALAESLLVLLESGCWTDLPRGADRIMSSGKFGGRAADNRAKWAILEILKDRGFVWPTAQSDYIRTPWYVANSVLIILAQLARIRGRDFGWDLQPSTTNRNAYNLFEHMLLAPSPSLSDVIALDLDAVVLDLDRVPLDEVLDFRRIHGSEFRAYIRSARITARQLLESDVSDRSRLLDDRREELGEAARRLQQHAERSWRQPVASYALGIAGGLLCGLQRNWGPALLSLLSGAVGANWLQRPESDYTYLFAAHASWHPARRARA